MLDRAGLLGGGDAVPAAIGVVRCAGRAALVPLEAEGFLAVEPDELVRERPGTVLEHAGQFDQERGARRPVARAEKRLVRHVLGVVVTGHEEPVRTRAGQRDDPVPISRGPGASRR